jgi:spore maturation protein CgeB
MTPRYLFIGSNASWGTSESRRRALVRLEREVVSVAYEAYQTTLKLLARLEVRTALGPWPWRLNAVVLQKARVLRPDIVWVERGTLIWPRMLEQIRDMGCLLVHYNTDDLLNSQNFWRNLYRTIPLYDVHITTNIPNVSELPAMGACSVIQSQLGYDDELCFPHELSQEDKLRLGADVSFIGHWEPATEEMLQYALDQQINSRIRGHNWHKAQSSMLRRIAKDGPIYLDEYAKAICAAKINLGIVSAWNRNQTAGRTFEIPACGGFLLAPRTEEVSQFYRENEEVVFYEDRQEMVDKARFYLKHDGERKHIADAGCRRCMTSGYSWLDRVRGLVTQIEQRLR